MTLWLLLSAAFGQVGDAWCYPSGLRVAAVSRAGPPIVGVATVIGGGSSAEKPGETGAAHTLEHLWFRSPRLGYDSVDDWLHEIGADANAYTTLDETTYLTVAPRRAIRSILQAEAARLLNPMGAIDQATFDNEKRVVQAEIDQRYDGRDPWLTSVTRALVPEGHAYSRTVSGSKDEVAALSQADIQRYASRSYLPSNASLYITGAIEPPAAQRLVETIFPPELLAAPADPANRAAGACEVVDDTVEEIPERPPAEWVTAEVGVSTPSSLIAWTIPAGFESTDTYSRAAQLMEWHLDASTKLRADCWVVPMARLGLLTCATETAPGKGEQTWKPGLKALGRLWKQIVAEADSKAEYWSAVAEYLDKSDRRASIRREEVLHSGGGILEQRAIEFHRSGGVHQPNWVTSRDAAAAASEWLRPERMVGITLVPAEARSGASTFHGARGGRQEATVDPGEVDGERLGSLVVDPGLSAIDARVVNDRKVWVMPVEGMSRTLMSAVYPGDSGWSDANLRTRAWDLLEDPWDMMDPEARRVASQRGIDVYMSQDDGFWAFESTGESPSTTAMILRKSTPPPVKTIPRAEDKAALEQLTAWREEASGTAGWRAAQVRWDRLADGLPHPLMDAGAIEAIQSIPRSKAQAFASTYLKPRRAVLVAVTPPERVEEVHRAFQKHFGVAEPGDAFTPSDPPLRQAKPRSITVLDAPDAGPQATVAVECHVGDGDGVDLWVLEEALKRDLNEALRNDLGVTYGVHPDFVYASHGLTLEVTTGVPHDASGAAIQAILDSVASGLEPADLGRYKLEIARRTALRWQSPDGLLALIQYAAASGREPGELGLARRLAAVDAERLAERLTPCRGYEAVTVVGRADVVGASLDEVGLDWSRWEP